MYIGRVVHVFYPEVIGDPFNAYDLSLRQTQAGNKVAVFTWTKRRSSYVEYVNDNFKIFRLRGLNMALTPFFSEYPLIPNLSEFIEKESPDILHAHSHLFLTTFYSIRASRKIGIPSIVSVHGLIADRDILTNFLQSAYLHSLTSWIFKNSTITICLTKSDANQVLQLGCPPEKLRIVPNAVDTEFFKPYPNMERDDLVVWTGRFVPEKGLTDLIKAAKIVVSINSRVKFLLIGGGPLKSRLFNLIRNFHLEKNVFLIGPVGKEEIAKYLAEASIFVFPSSREGMPKSILEAMSAGKPMIASDIPGINEIVKDGVNGVLVPPKNPEKLASAILTLLEDENLRKKMGKCARNIALERFSWEKILNMLSSVYEEAIRIGVE